MDLLLQEIAKTFNITNESISLIIQNYPELKQQYIINHILTNLFGFLSLTMAIPIISFFFSWLSVDKYTPDDEKRKSIKIQKYSIVALVTIVVLLVILNIIIPILSPDIVILKDLISSIKK
jgi:hypothetical protein